MAREVTRRGFVKLTSAAALGVAGMGTVTMSVPAAKALAESAPPEGMWVRTRVHQLYGFLRYESFRARRTDKDDFASCRLSYERYNPRGCLKGLSINTMIHGPERLTAPLVRNEQGQMEERIGILLLILQQQAA